MSGVGAGGRIALLAVVTVVASLWAVTVGSSGLPISDVVGVIASHIPGLDVDITWGRTTDAIVWQTRLPRIIGALAVGAVLGVAGVILQAIVRNPLAEPYVLGVSSGASTGAAIAMVIIGATASFWVGTLAFAGALLATFMVLGIAGRSHSATTLILSGLAVGFGFQAVTNLITFSSGSPETSRAVMFWTLGSLGRVRWADLLAVVIAAVLTVVVAALLGPILDALASGDRTAQAVGIEPSRYRVGLLVPTSAAMLALSACGTSAADKKAQSSGAEGSAAGFPVTVNSCDEELTFEKAPEKVLVLSGTNFAILDELDLLDRVTARAGEKNLGPESKELQEKLNAIPSIDAGEVESGGAAVSVESVLDSKADLVIGYDTGVDRTKLREAGVPLYAPEAMCENYSVDKATFTLVDDEINKMAQVFGVTDRAQAVIDSQHKLVADIKPAGVNEGDNAAMLYITPGSTTFYAYGTSSMVQPILEANKLKNAYEDQTTRVFDASMEDLLNRNPDWIVLLAMDAIDKEVTDTFLGFNGAQDLKAVGEKKVVVLPFALTDPPSTLSVQGASELAKLIDAK